MTYFYEWIIGLFFTLTRSCPANQPVPFTINQKPPTNTQQPPPTALGGSRGVS